MRPVIKSIVYLLLLAGLFFSCTPKKSTRPLSLWMEENGKVKILSTIAQVGDLVTAVGGERVDGWVLVPGDLDPHSYELVKGDGEKMGRADLIFYNGLGLEHGASLSALLRANPKAVSLGEAIRKRSPERTLAKGAVIDPHVWMDISLWKEGVQEIRERLSMIDPEGAPYFQERAEKLEMEMEEAHRSIYRSLQQVPSNQRYLVTSHDAFRYFARAYLRDPEEADWSNRVTSPEGLAPDGQLNPVDIQRSIEFLKEHQISVVFPESNISREAVKKIAAASREMGYEVRLCETPLYGDSPSGLKYLDMMRRNGEVLCEQLGK